jgi:hypothetical protein
VRFRLDGVLQDIETLSSSYASPIVSRIKVMARLNARLGRAGELAGDELLTGLGYTILAKHLFVLTSRGLRITDIVAAGGPQHRPLTGFEIKVNGSIYTATQQMKDRLIETQGGKITSWGKSGFDYGLKIRYPTLLLNIIDAIP